MNGEGVAVSAPFGRPLADDDLGVPVRLPSSMVAAMRTELASRGAYAVPRVAAILYLIDSQRESS